MVASVPFTLFIILWICLNDAISVIQLESFNTNLNAPKEEAVVPKVTLTQKGYIQFLKYVVDVPEIADYTFCIWVKSFNLTYSHPLISYSRHEQDRLVRVWISPQGTHINLELLEVPVFSVPVYVKEHQWYHVCQSWSSEQGAWSLYLDGKLKASGHQPKLRGVSIPPEGDIVVGQEYTDFDKGLDDGIEGSISGFNLVLAPAFHYVPEPHYMNSISMGPEEKSKGPTFWKRSFDVSSDRQTPRRLYRSTYFQPQDKFTKPLGQLLVELSNDCGYLRGAPLSGRDVLVSWTKTEVRVFGGAILKTVPPFCPK